MRAFSTPPRNNSACRVASIAALLSAALALPAAACGTNATSTTDATPPDVPPDAGCTPPDCRARAGEFPANPTNALDILVVVDNSGSMSEEQTSMASCFPNWTNFLQLLPAGLPDLHIGVVSTNLGTGPFETTGCMGDGDGGRLLSTPHGACTPPSGNYISNVSDGMGGRLTNYPTTTVLPDVFTCIARLGSTGCGLEQPFEAMKRALDGSNVENAGFLRDDAMLAILFLGDEDDCSVFDPALFDPDDATLGPFGSFRCTEYGIECDGAPVGREPATYTNCQPRTDSPYMAHPDVYIDFLVGLKPRGQLFISMVSGPPGPVAVALDADGDPALQPACGAGTPQSAAPGVRQAALANAFPNSFRTDICVEQLDDAMRSAFGPVGQAMAHSLTGGGGCLAGPIASTPDACRVYDLHADLTGVDIPPCSAAAPTCYTIEDRPSECDFTDSHKMLTVNRSASPPPGTSVMADCLAP